MQFIWHPHSASIDEFDAYEFTVTQFGIASYDKIVGSSPEFVNGQLNNVIEASFLGVA